MRNHHVGALVVVERNDGAPDREPRFRTPRCARVCAVPVDRFPHRR
jgi:hypothetical protein